MLFRLPQAKRVSANPSPEEVKELAARMRTARRTKYGNLNVQTEVLARSKRSTYLVTDDPDGQNQSITTDDGATWTKLVYDRGGMPLHAGCKIIATEDGDKVCLTVGLSGTGKTTTTFTRQNGSLPVQDDFVAWMPDGRIYVSETGCFAKTYGLNPEDEPTIYGAVTQPDSYLENVSQHGDDLDFYDESYTQNGR